MTNDQQEQPNTVPHRALLAICAAALVAFVAPPVTAQQQPPRRFTFGIAGGLSRASAGTGYHAVAALDIRTPLRVLGLRAEGLFSDVSGVGVTRVSSILGSATIKPFPQSIFAPYAIAGAGGYATSGAGLRPGWSLGLGLQLPDLAPHLLIETRVHAFRWDGRNVPAGTPAYTSYDSWEYVWMPISLGIRF